MRIRLFGRTFLAFGRMCLEAFADLFAASAFASRTRARKSNNSQYEELTVSRSSCSSMIFCNLVSARPHWLQKLMIADFRRDRRKVQWNFLLARRSCLNVMRQTRRQAADPRKTVVHSNPVAGIGMLHSLGCLKAWAFSPGWPSSEHRQIAQCAKYLRQRTSLSEIS